MDDLLIEVLDYITVNRDKYGYVFDKICVIIGQVVGTIEGEEIGEDEETGNPKPLGIWWDDFHLDYYEGAWEKSGDYAEVYFGRYNNLPAVGSVRFTLHGAIPSGATITSATLTVRPSYWDDIVSDVWLYITESENSEAIPYDSMSRPDWIDSGDITTYPTTEEGLGSVHWSGNWKGWGETKKEIDISTLIQHLVSTYGGLADGTHITIWITGDNSLSENWMAFRSQEFCNDPTIGLQGVPRLGIEYAEPSAGPNIGDLVGISENISVEISSTLDFYISSSQGITISEVRSVVVFSENSHQGSAIDLVYATESVSVSIIVAYGKSTYIVPAGITKLSIEAWGMGGDGSPGTVGFGGRGGGGGAYATALIDVTPGETLTTFIGSNPNAVDVPSEVYRDYAGPGQELLLRAQPGNKVINGDAGNSVGDERYSGGYSPNFNYPQEYGFGGGGAADARYLAIGGDGRDCNNIAPGSGWRVGYPGAGGYGESLGLNGHDGETAAGGGGGGKGSTTGGLGGSGLIIICETPAVGVTDITVSDIPNIIVEIPNTFTVTTGCVISVSESRSLLISEVLCSVVNSINIQEFVAVYVSGEIVVINIQTYDLIVVEETVILSVSVVGAAVYVKVGGVWTPVLKVWIKAGGVWKESVSKVKVSGDWKP